MQRDACPECGQAEGLPIIWGCKPSEDAAKLIARGEAIHGGCDIFGAAVCGTILNRECEACGHQWTAKKGVKIRQEGESH